jgi:hypothetical protein
MKIVAYAIADCVVDLNKKHIIPNSINNNIASKVAEAVVQAYGHLY